MALGDRSGGGVPRSGLLPLVVRCDDNPEPPPTQPSFSWYKRSEYGLRAAVFFSAASVSGAFGGLLSVREACAVLGYPLT